MLSGASAGGLRHLVGRNPVSVNWWQGIGGLSVGQKAWMEPFGGPGQGRVKALIASVKQTAWED